MPFRRYIPFTRHLLSYTRCISRSPKLFGMSQAPMSYSAALSGGASSQQQAHKRQSSTPSSSGKPEPPSSSPPYRRQHEQQLQEGQNAHNPHSPPRQQQHQHQHQGPSGAYTRETYTRRSEQTPRTNVKDEKHYIISLSTTTPMHKALTDLRNQHFPKHLNKLQSHLALFRALPGSRLDQIVSDVEKLCAHTQPFDLRTAAAPFRLRQGVGIKLEGGKQQVVSIFKELEGPWAEEGFLSDQDKSFSPHWTVQNKVEDEAAVSKSMQEVEGVLRKDGDGKGGGLTGTATGLALFRYEKGYWKFERNFRFGSATEE